MDNSDRFSSSNAGNQEDRSFECRCCYYEFPFELMIQCPSNGRHLFCSSCIRRQVEAILFGSSKPKGYLPCMYTHNCDGSIPLFEVQRALPNNVFEIYEERLAQQAIIEAKLENMVYCPFCNIPYEVDECVQVLDCANPKCLRASCIQCKEPSHIPLSCEEAENISDTAARRKVEERMAKAVIRKCNNCKAELVKMDGCNKMTCSRCGTMMCYICRETKFSSAYHFCDHSNFYREQGKPCQICNKICSMWETEVEDNVALDAKEEALKELADEQPSLIDQEIGPPLARQTQPVHDGRDLQGNKSDGFTSLQT